MRCFACGAERNASVMWKVWISHRKRSLCEECWLRWSVTCDGMPRLRALSADEAAACWIGQYSQVDYAVYQADVRSMKPNTTYEIEPEPNVSRLSTRRRLDYAARQIGAKLAWASLKGDKTRLICRLDQSTERRNGVSRPEQPAQALAARSAF